VITEGTGAGPWPIAPFEANGFLGRNGRRVGPDDAIESRA
jgi:hypothetical protein